MAQPTPDTQTELERREAALAAREAELARQQAEYDKLPLTVHQMDIIIGVLFALIALFLVLGVTHTSFFGLFGG